MHDVTSEIPRREAHADEALTWIQRELQLHRLQAAGLSEESEHFGKHSILKFM